LHQVLGDLRHTHPHESIAIQTGSFGDFRGIFTGLIGGSCAPPPPRTARRGRRSGGTQGRCRFETHEDWIEAHQRKRKRNATACSQTGCSGLAPAPELFPFGTPAAATSPCRAFMNKPYTLSSSYLISFLLKRRTELTKRGRGGLSQPSELG